MLADCIYLKRRQGKTTKALKLCAKIGADLVVINFTNAQMVKENPEYKKEINLFTHRQLIDGTLNGNRKPLVIDEVQHLLSILSAGQIRAFTCSKPFSKKDREKYGLPKGVKY